MITGCYGRFHAEYVAYVGFVRHEPSSSGLSGVSPATRFGWILHDKSSVQYVVCGAECVESAMRFIRFLMKIEDYSVPVSAQIVVLWSINLPPRHGP